MAIVVTLQINTTWLAIRKAVFSNDVDGVMRALKSDCTEGKVPNPVLAAYLIGYFLAEIAGGKIGDIWDPDRVAAIFATVDMVLTGPPYAFGDTVDRKAFARWMLCAAIKHSSLGERLLVILRPHCDATWEEETKTHLAKQNAAAVAATT